LQEKSKLQRSQAELEEHIAELQRELTAAKDERNMYKNKYETLVHRILAMQNKNA
jgi:predicted  nucleic acid-binding Zn-ribbon protein